MDFDEVLTTKGTFKSNKCCGVYGCSARKDADTQLHAFPTKKALQRRWIAACRIGRKITKNTYVCSNHFVETDYYKRHDISKRKSLKIGVVPSQNLPVSSHQNHVKDDHERQFRRLRRAQLTAVELEVHSESISCAETCMEEQSSPEKAIQVNVAEIGVQANVLFENITDVRPIEEIVRTERDLKSWTGLPSFKLLSAIEDCVATLSPESSGSKNLSLRENVMLVFIKMKMNLTFSSMSAIFHISVATISRNFSSTLQVLRAALEPTIRFQTSNQIRSNLPKCFKANFRNVRAILDCSEIAIQLPNCQNCRIATYSHYKGTNTAKFLIAVSPSGTIMHMSKAYSGKTSDKQIFNDECLIDKFDSETDAVMVDKGFAIETELNNKYVKLIRPSFSLGKQFQFEYEEMVRNTNIAVARVHVERSIQRLKIFNILSKKIDHNILKHLDDMLIVAAAITNLSNPILASDKF